MNLKDLTFERHKLTSQLVLPVNEGHETYLHPLAGSGFFTLLDRKYEMERQDGVFSAPQPGWLVGGLHPISISPRESLDLVIVYAKVDGPTPIEPVRVAGKRHMIGCGPSQRTVYEILGGGGPSQRIRFGETVNARGGWSSWPGHSFDKQPEIAPQFEEVFLCFTRPRDGYGLIRLSGTYQDGFECDGARIVRSGDTFQVPLGTHPIVGAPDTDLMYVWAYLSPVDKIYGTWAEERGTYL